MPVFQNSFQKNKAGELKLTVLNLLNQNKPITRTIGENYFEDNRTNVIRRYFIVSLTYNLNHTANRNQMPQSLKNMMDSGMKQFRN